MLRATQILILFVASVFLLACESQGTLTGEVFIVTESRENIKLALEKITLLKKKTFENYIENKSTRTSSLYFSYADSIARKIEIIDSLANNTEYAEYNEAPEILRETEEAEVGDKVIAYSSNGGPAIVNTQPFTDKDIRSIPYGTKGEVKKVKEVIEDIQHDYLVDFGETNVWVSGLWLVHSDMYHGAKRASEIGCRINELESELSDKVKSLYRSKSKSTYFEGIPSSKYVSKTGPSGKYTIKKVPVGSYYVLAKSKRKTRSGTERYYWVVPLNIKEGKNTLDLTNENTGIPMNVDYTLTKSERDEVRSIIDKSMVFTKWGSHPNNVSQRLQNVVRDNKNSSRQ